MKCETTISSKYKNNTILNSNLMKHQRKSVAFILYANLTNLGNI